MPGLSLTRALLHPSGDLFLSGLQRERVGQIPDHDIKITGFNRRLVVRADEGEIIAAQSEVKVTALSRLKINLGKAFDPFAWYCQLNLMKRA